MIFVKLVKQEIGVDVLKEYQFDSKRKWRFDYFIPEINTGIEVEGGTFKKTWYKDKRTGLLKSHIGGRHNTGKGFLNDCEKYNSAIIMGYKVLRFSPEKLMTVKTLQIIKLLCNKNLT